MKEREVSKLLENGVKARLGGVFKKLKYGHYLKNIGDLYFDFGFGIVNSDNSFPSTFSCSFGCRSYSNLLNYMIDNLGLNFQKSDYLFACGIHQMCLFDEGKYPTLEYDIYTEADAQKMVDEVSAYILNEVLPEWEANPTLEYLEKKANEKCLTDELNLSGLILAKLLGKPKYESIKQHFITVSKDWHERNKKDFEKIIEFLDNHSQEELWKIAETPIQSRS